FSLLSLSLHDALPILFFDLPFESTDCPADFRSIRDDIEHRSAVECADCDYGGFQRVHSTGYDGLELLDQRGCSNYRIDCVMWFRPVSALALYGDIERICIGIRIVICI